ncbi:MAG: 4-hydroxy-tetrahydrodipicolinate reductase [Treponema sp.]|jgi:4-hydroxy-tetrahydrodipicolinate reductase|nr:4-hydroxy-tetrahydrodipicolinate reductase [Treponema sp.]
MNFALIGYGKMGRLVEQQAQERGHTVVCIVDPAGTAPYTKLNETPLSTVDCAFEFTNPSVVWENIQILIQRQIPVVVGTTGWYGHLEEARQLIDVSHSSLLYAPNFSIGVQLFYNIATAAASMVEAFPEYDIGGFEIHHNKKADSPSGTAKTLMEQILNTISRKKTVLYEKLDRQIAEEEVQYASLRVGSVPGTHALLFDSPFDTIEIRHTARNREGFASGAINAAEWLVAEQRQGIFTLKDLLC